MTMLRQDHLPAFAACTKPRLQNEFHAACRDVATIDLLRLEVDPGDHKVTPSYKVSAHKLGAPPMLSLENDTTELCRVWVTSLNFC